MKNPYEHYEEQIFEFDDVGTCVGKMFHKKRRTTFKMYFKYHGKRIMCKTEQSDLFNFLETEPIGSFMAYPEWYLN